MMGADILEAVVGMGVLVECVAGCARLTDGAPRCVVRRRLCDLFSSVHAGVIRLAGVVSLLVLMANVQMAEANYGPVGVFAAHDSGEGELGEDAIGDAVNDSNGEVYIADGFNANYL